MTTDDERAGGVGGGLRTGFASLRDLVLRDKMGSVLARGSTHAFAIAIGSVGLGFITQFVLARALGISSFGAYTYVTGWMATVLLFVKLDFDTVAVRFVSAYTEGQPDSGMLRGLLRFVMGGSVGLATLVGVIGIVTLLSREEWRSTEVGQAAVVACVLLPAMTALLVSGGALQGFHRILQAQLPFYVIRPVGYIAALGAVILFVDAPLDAPSALALNLVAALLGIGVSFWWLRKAVKTTEWAPAKYARRQWTRTGVELLPASLAQQALGQTTDVIVIGTMLTFEASGTYSIAGQIVMLVGFGIGAIATIAAPMISALHEKGDKSELRRLLILITRANILYTIPAFLGIVLVGGPVLGLFGPAFREAYPVLLILALGPVTSIFGGPAGTMLTMTGFQRDAAFVIGTCAILNLTLAIILTLQFGVVGTASATVFAGAVRNTWLPIIAVKRLGVSMRPW